MFVTALLLGLVGVFCILDSRILGRMNFERPLITCTIVGALLGDLQTGLTLGASIELMSLGIVNIGAAAPPDMNMAAIICAAFCHPDRCFCRDCSGTGHPHRCSGPDVGRADAYHPVQPDPRCRPRYCRR